MEFRNLDEKDYPHFLELYNSSFPENERRLYKSAEHVANFIKEKGGKFHGFAVDDRSGDPEMQGPFLGFLTYWTFEGYVYIEHFAVNPEFRGKRIGRDMLHHLFKTVSENVLIEVEKPETDEARRRIAFYEREGFKLREDINYVQRRGDDAHDTRQRETTRHTRPARDAHRGLQREPRCITRHSPKRQKQGCRLRYPCFSLYIKTDSYFKITFDEALP